MGCSLSTEKGDVSDMYVKSQTQPSPNGGYFDDHYFTQKQKQIIRDTWDKINNNQVEKGVQIFLRIFEKKPDAKELFPFRHLEGESLVTNTTFRCHARRFMDAIGNTVMHLDALDVSCAPTLILLGRKHAWIKHFMTGGYLEAFVESVASVFEMELPDSTHDDVYDAWYTVFSFLVSKICEGYNEAVDKNEITTSEQVHLNETEIVQNGGNLPTSGLSVGDNNNENSVSSKWNNSVENWKYVSGNNEDNVLAHELTGPQKDVPTDFPQIEQSPAENNVMEKAASDKVVLNHNAIDQDNVRRGGDEQIKGQDNRYSTETPPFTAENIDTEIKSCKNL